MTPANRRLQDRIEILVTKAVGTRDAGELEQVIQDLREALDEHAREDAKRVYTGRRSCGVSSSSRTFLASSFAANGFWRKAVPGFSTPPSTIASFAYPDM